MPRNEGWVDICDAEINRLQQEVDELKDGKRRIWLEAKDGEWIPAPDAIPNLERQIAIYTESLAAALAEPE